MLEEGTITKTQLQAMATMKWWMRIISEHYHGDAKAQVVKDRVSLQRTSVEEYHHQFLITS